MGQRRLASRSACHGRPHRTRTPFLPHSSATRSPSGSRVRLYPSTAFDHGRRPAPTDSTPSRPTRCARAASSEDLYPPTLPRPYLVSTCTLIPGRIFSSCVRWRAVEARPAKECPRVSRVDLAGWRAHARADDSVGEAAAPAGSGGRRVVRPRPRQLPVRPLTPATATFARALPRPKDTPSPAAPSARPTGRVRLPAWPACELLCGRGADPRFAPPPPCSFQTRRPARPSPLARSLAPTARWPPIRARGPSRQLAARSLTQARPLLAGGLDWRRRGPSTHPAPPPPDLG